MRLVVVGTPEMAVPPLRALHAAGHDIALVVSGADTRRGRGKTTSPSPVKAAALELGLPVTAEPDDALAVGDVDLGVVVAYGRIIRPHLLAAIPMVNLHFSLLPRWRGAAPVQRAILAGDTVTGVCVMEVAEGLDTGEVFARAEVPLEDSVDAAELRSTLVRIGTQLLVTTLADGLGDPVPQPDEGVTYAAKITTEDLRIDWTAPASQVHRVVRIGGAWTTFRGERLKVLRAVPAEAPPAHHGDEHAGGGGTAPSPGTIGDGLHVACGQGWLVLEQVQPAGRGPMSARDWANGARPVGERLGG